MGTDSKIDLNLFRTTSFMCFSNGDCEVRCRNATPQELHKAGVIKVVKPTEKTNGN